MALAEYNHKRGGARGANHPTRVCDVIAADATQTRRMPCISSLVTLPNGTRCSGEWLPTSRRLPR